jgi:MFS family permease
MIGFAATFGLSLLILGLGQSPMYQIAGAFGLGFFLSLTNAHWQSLMQTKVGLELQGRVIATNRMLALSMMPLGYWLAGPLAGRVFEPLMTSENALSRSIGWLIGTGPGRGIGLIVALVGAILFILGGIGFKYRPLRFMEDELPDAISDTLIVRDKDELQKQADRQLLAETA